MKRKTIVSKSLQVMLAVIFGALDLQGGEPPSRSGKLKSRVGYGVVASAVGTVGTIEGAASTITVRVLVDVFPQVSVATYSIVSVATCEASIKMLPDRTPLMNVR